MSEHGTHAEENAVARAREDFARGEYRWVAQVMTHVLFTELENRDARAACRRLRNSGTSRNPPPTRISSARRSCGCPPELLSCYDHASERRRGRTQMRLKTALCERLGIELPIIQAPMGGAVGPSLAAAVSNAGALGMLVPWRADLEAVRQ